MSYLHIFLNILGSIVLYQQEPSLGLYFLSLGSMLLFNLIFIKSLGHDESIILRPRNDIMAKIAMLTHLLQPIALAVFVFAYGTQMKDASSILFLVYLTFISYFIYNFFHRKSIVSIQKHIDRREDVRVIPIWNWIDTKYETLFFTLYISLTLSLLFQHFQKPLNYIIVGVSIITLIYVLYNPSTNNPERLMSQKTKSPFQSYIEIMAILPLFIFLLFRLAQVKRIRKLLLFFRKN